MDENMKSIILIGNSTFSFAEDVQGDQGKSRHPGEGSSMEPQGPRRMEQCIFDGNFGQFGYFTQDYSNLTVYLNDATLLTRGGGADGKADNQWGGSFGDGVESYPFFSGQHPVDFPFITAESLPVGKLQLNDSVQYLNPLSSKIDSDAPEYIDINSLVIPSEYQQCFLQDGKRRGAAVPPFLKRNRRSKSRTANSPGRADDDDVIFVKEYKNCEGEGESLNKPEKIFPEPRRNPKRQVQLQKVSYELASKLSLEGFYDSRKYTAKDLSNTRRSTRTTGAVFNPPNPLGTYDFKEWPVDGMHQMPSFNPMTKKVEKLPNLPKRMKLAPRAAVGQHARRKTPNAKKRPAKDEEMMTSKEFASLTHGTFHHVLSYACEVRRYIDLMRDADIKGVHSNGTGDEVKLEKTIAADLDIAPVEILGIYDEDVIGRNKCESYTNSIGDLPNVEELCTGAETIGKQLGYNTCHPDDNFVTSNNDVNNVTIVGGKTSDENSGAGIKIITSHVSAAHNDVVVEIGGSIIADEKVFNGEQIGTFGIDDNVILSKENIGAIEGAGGVAKIIADGQFLRNKKFNADESNTYCKIIAGNDIFYNDKIEASADSIIIADNGFIGRKITAAKDNGASTSVIGNTIMATDDKITANFKDLGKTQIVADVEDIASDMIITGDVGIGHEDRLTTVDATIISDHITFGDRIGYYEEAGDNGDVTVLDTVDISSAEKIIATHVVVEHQNHACAEEIVAVDEEIDCGERLDTLISTNEDIPCCTKTTNENSIPDQSVFASTNFSGGANKLKAVEDILLDSCIVYSLVNDLDQVSLVKYLNSLCEHKDIAEHLKSIVEDCETAECHEKK